MTQGKRVAAIMTAARYENTWARSNIEQQLRRIGIPLTVSGGVYYGQCMQLMLEQLCGTDCELVVTVDGDTVFTASQLRRLISIVSQEETIDAITGFQIRRGKKDLLGTDGGEGSLREWSGYPLKVRTAHFGLTVIKLDRLRDVPKPWFIATPNASGQWTGDKIDDDVHFWFQWERAGRTIYMDPGVRLGHLEEMISVYDDRFNPIHVYPADWSEVDVDSASETVAENASGKPV